MMIRAFLDSLLVAFQAACFTFFVMAPAGLNAGSAKLPDAVPARNSNPNDIVFAYENTGTPVTHMLHVDELTLLLQKAFPDRRVVVRGIASGVFEETIQAQKIPFIISSAGTAVTLMMHADTVPLSIREVTETDLVPSGGLLVVQPEFKGSDLSALKNARLALQADASFGLLQWLEGRIFDEHLDPENFFREVIRTENAVPDVLDAVLSGRADAGLLPVCTLERLTREGLLDSEALRPFAVRPQSGVCKASTPSYPFWVMSYSLHADAKDVRQAAAAVFSTPQTGESHWGARVDLSEVQTLMRNLYYGPYSYLKLQSFSGVVTRYKDVFIGFTLVVLLLILHVIRTNFLVRRRTQELEDALQEKRRLEVEAKLSRERLTSIERRGMLSQMSSMFAHELKQPLTSVRYAVEGIKLWMRQLESLGLDTHLPEKALASASEETQRITAIVERVRGYAKAHMRALEPVDWTKIVRSAVTIVRRHDSQCAPIRILNGEYLKNSPQDDVCAKVLGEPLELELLVINLVRNASQAVYGEPDALVTVALEKRRGGKYVLSVADNGPALDDETFARLAANGDSIKTDGLGIGLSICRGIADRHGAELHFRRLRGRGICAEAVMDVLSDDSEVLEDSKVGKAQKELNATGD